MTWYVLTAGNINLDEEIRRAAGTSPLPAEEGFAIFCRAEPSSGVIRWYFSPGASKVAVSFGARPCEKPIDGKEDLVLVVGRADAKEHHFPGTNGRP